MAGPFITATGPQPEQTGESLSGLAKLGFASAGIAASGFIPTRRGRLWDTYLQGIRAAETASPAAILRTFRVSEFLSPFERWKPITVPAEHMVAGGKYTEFLKSTFGPSINELTMTPKGAVFGEVRAGGKAVGLGIQMKAGTQKGAAIADYYARITGTSLSARQSLNEALLKSEYFASAPGVPYNEWVKSMDLSKRTRRLILGAKYREKVNILGKDLFLSKKVQERVAKLEITGQVLRAKAASTAGRLNTLLTKPFEAPVIGEALQKLPLIKTMAVKPSSAIQFFARYTKKALIAGAAYKGLEYYDYLRSQGSPWATALGVSGGALAGGALFKGVGRRFSPLGLAVGAGVGLYTSMAPRFDEGLFHGVASIFTDASLARSRFSRATGLTQSLQRQQEVTPGLVSVKTALGFAGVGALGAGLYGYGGLLGASVKEKFLKGGLGADIIENLREARAGQMAGKLWGSKFGKAVGKIPGGKYLTKIKSPMALGAIGGLAAYGVLSTGLSLLSGNVGAALPGASLFGTTETPEELEAIYSGEQDVAIRKGRWWEFGRSTAYEGGRVEYYRPHMLHRLKTRAYQRGLYGSEEERWEHDPLMHPLKALFGDDEWKYHYERKYQYERPAPLTGTYGEDVPFIGPLVAATIGKMLKPRKMVRPEEWNFGGGEYAHLPDTRGETEPAYDLGGIGPGAPVSPEDKSQLFNELMYRRREAVGLVGFAEGAIEKALTGREEVFQNLQTLGVMGKETGSEYWLWSHLNVGGALGASEPIRRFIPHTRSYLEEYNPLKNTMPSWMPQDYFLDLTHGNPFKKVKEAEIRLPGPGYAALHPEVKGLAAEEYPLIHRLKILGDVAMWSDEYKQALSKAKRNMGRLSDQERQMVGTIEEQVKSKKVRREFTPYRFRPELLEEEQVTVTDVLDPRRIKTAEYGDAVIELQGFGAVTNMANAMEFAKNRLEGNKIQLKTPAMESRKYDITKKGSRIKAVAMLGDMDYGQALVDQEFAQYKELRDEFEQLRFTPREQLAGRLGEAALHGIETPLEMLTPMSPASKLIRQRSPIEEYVASEAIGTGNAFWDRPVENFLKPAANMTLAEVGFDEIPEEIRQRRGINEYFDMLAWTKARQAETKAREVSNWKEVKESQKAQQETLFGLDVFGSPVAAMKALPRRERDFFNAFSNAPSPEERQQILEYIPEDEQRIYMAQWLRQEETAARAKQEAGIATKYDDHTLAAANMMRRSEGFGITPELEEQWMAETNGQIPFDDWIREKKAEEYFASHSLPGADWLGWHPSVDLDDVKMKYVEMAGLDHHDFDLWGARRRALARKPYINDELIAQMGAQSNIDNLAMSRANAKAIAGYQGESKVSFSNIGADLPPRYDIEIVDKRDGLVREAHKRLGAR